MPVDPDDIEAIVANVSAIYREGELALLRQVADHLREHPGAPTAFAQPRAEALASLRRAAGSIQAAMEADGSRALREGIAAAWRLGTRAAVADLPSSWLPGSGIGQAADAARDLVPQQGAIEALATALVRDVGDRVENVLRDVLDAFRSAVAGATARMLAGGQDRRTATQAAWSALVRQGVTGFTDRSGRRWRLYSYVEMAVRTASARAAVNGQADRLRTLDVDLVYISDHMQECPLCRPWEGRILRLSDGPTGRIEVPHATDDDRTVTVEVAGTVAQARAAGLWHPNCRHSMSGYLPGVTRVPAGRPDSEGYDARMRQRHIERKIRRWKEQENAATTDEARTTARRKVLDWQAAMRGHLAEHPELKRLRYREAASAGSTPARGDTSGPVTPLGPDVQSTLDGDSATAPHSATAEERPDLVAVNPAPNPAAEEHQRLMAERENARRYLPSGLPRVGRLIPADDTEGMDRRGAIEDAVADAIQGDYAGLTVTLDQVDAREDFLNFEAVITDGGRRVGNVERTFRRDRDGTLWVVHDFLRLDRNVHGQGFAEAWNGFLERWYREAGLERIEVHANIDVGGYTWARQGFDFADDGAADEIMDRLERELDAADQDLAGMDDDDPDRPGLEDEVAAAADILDRHNNLYFGEDDYPTAYEVSQCGRQPHHTGRSADWIGKRAMLGSDWQGVKWL